MSSANWHRQSQPYGSRCRTRCRKMPWRASRTCIGFLHKRKRCREIWTGCAQLSRTPRRARPLYTRQKAQQFSLRKRGQTVNRRRPRRQKRRPLPPRRNIDKNSRSVLLAAARIEQTRRAGACSRLRFRGLHDVQLDTHDAAFGHLQRFSGGRGNVDGAPADERTTIVDPDRNRPPIG